MGKKYAKIIINSESISLDREFTYIIPEKFIDVIAIGYRVKVPFGAGNKKVQGFVVGFCDEIDFNPKFAKEISEICDDDPLFGSSELELINFMRKEYLCKYIDAIRVFLPTGIIRGNSLKKKSVVKINSNMIEDSIYFEKYKDVLEQIKANDGMYTKTELNKILGISTYKINKLFSDNLLTTDELIMDRANQREYMTYERKDLTLQQRKVVSDIVDNEEKIFLLKGVTGSGKTEVYMNLVENMLNENKTSLVLVPEISLTPQMIERFKGRFGKDVAVFHSKLSDGERFDEWNRVKNNSVKLVVGARSAIFLPFKALGLIIVDEEHEGTYKSEQNPKYSIRDIAEFKSRQCGCKVVYGTATPSVETYYRALRNEIGLVTLEQRVDSSPMPNISVVDMREELKSGNRNIFSRELYDALKENLQRKEQSIIFLNRRGFSTFVSCRSCGYVFTCDSCDISMTYHKNGYLICHYCGKTKPQPKICPKCGSKYVKYFGAGTEQIENYIRNTFQDARVLRMDVDTTRKKNSHEEIYNKFKNGEADILVGTQMISKGLDFPNVTLVGIVAADITLNLPDFRASERGFQIITQVAGRAGRGEKEGRVILQTYNPEHSSIKFASQYNYNDFFKEEISLRNIMNYPPFGDLLLINISGSKEGLVKKYSLEIGNCIQKNISDNDGIQILGPCACTVQKIKDQFRWQILIKGKLNEFIKNNVRIWVYDIIKDVYNEIRVSLDVNPNSLL